MTERVMQKKKVYKDLAQDDLFLDGVPHGVSDSESESDKDSD